MAVKWRGRGPGQQGEGARGSLYGRGGAVWRPLWLWAGACHEAGGMQEAEDDGLALLRWRCRYWWGRLSVSSGLSFPF